MKKFVLMLAVIATLVACEDEDTTKNLQKFYLKSDVEDASLLQGFKDYNADDCSFYAEDIKAVTTLLATDAYSGYQWEVFSEDGELLVSWPSVTSKPEYTSSPTVAADMTVKDCAFRLLYQTAYWTEYVEHPALCMNSGLYCDPLLSVYTSSEYWKVKDDRAVNEMKRQGYIVSSDLNTGCGFDSDYAHAYFGGLRENMSKPFILDDELSMPTLSNKDYTISGLRLVVKPGGNPDTYITDPDGNQWMLVGSHAGNSDMNNDAGGDYLYLYFTTNYTGRKITIVNPFLFHYEKETEDGYCGVRNQYNGIAYMLLGSICTWVSDATDSNKITVEEFKDQLVASVKAQANEVNDLITVEYTHAMEERVDFIRMYDEKMYPLYEGYPANFNRGAKGDYNIFISYSYITENDYDYWSKF